VVTKVGVGQSGAGVYRVESGGAAYVLKIATDADSGWRRRVAIHELAASAGLAPAVVHVDEARHAVVSAFVADRGFGIQLATPATREAALALLGRTLRRAHDLPRPEDTDVADPVAMLERIAGGLAGFPVPPFAAAAMRGARTAIAPPSDRALVLSHNDVNPSNLVLEGDRLLLLDWDTASANDPLYDLAAAAVFFRFDDATCLALLAAHDGRPSRVLPPRFAYLRQLVAAMVGTFFLHLARNSGHAGDPAAAPVTLSEFYQRLRAGTVNLGNADGRWAFGLALLDASGRYAAT
jgi:aminoglycoside phosphotransferase (APT) family kinase protein